MTNYAYAKPLNTVPSARDTQAQTSRFYGPRSGNTLSRFDNDIALPASATLAQAA